MAKKPTVKKTPPKKPSKNGAKPSSVKPAKAKPGHNSDQRSFDEKRESFLQHRSAWNGATAKVKAAKKIMDDVVASAKADGVTKKELQMADTLMGLGGEGVIKAEVTTRLRIARYLGLAIGNQMDLFAEPDRTPAVDRAFDEGKQASMENQTRKPPYDPSTPQYAKWLEGYADHQKFLASKIGRGNDDKDLLPRHLQQMEADRKGDAKPN